MSLSSWIRNWKRSLERRWALHQAIRSKRAALRHATRPRLEALEDRWLFSVDAFLVNNTGDNGGVNPSPGQGTGTLRQAIVDANADHSGNAIEIDFNIGTQGSSQTITPEDPLPILTANGSFINGLSQGGSGNTTRLITLNGQTMTTKADGLELQASGCVVSGLIIENFSNNGIELNGSSNTVSGNFITANVGDGVVLDSSADNNLIGGTTTSARNVISGNSTDGILISTGATGASVQGNYIGTDLTGTTALGNATGIVDDAGNSNTIGGIGSAARNIISGNSGDGVFLLQCNNVQVEGNFIGTDVSGTKAVGNSVGILDDAAGNTIGGTGGAGNVISGNTGDGVLLQIKASGVTVQGNYIGTNSAGVGAVGNSVGIEVALSGVNTIGGTAGGAGNVISGNSNDGVLIDSGVSGVQVQGNRIGTDFSGTTGVGNSIGVEVKGSTNTIGGTVASAGNVISGNNLGNTAGVGVLIDSGVSGVQIQGNYIGTNSSGAGAVRNYVGVLAQGTNDTIGGTSSGAGNTISGNSADGVSLTSSSAVLVAGNFIGTDVSGTKAVGNSIGVLANGSASTIGGTSSTARNVISGNSNNGISIVSSGTLVEGNYIGTNSTGAGPVGNSIGIATSATNTTIGGTTSGARNLISGNQNDGVYITGSSGVLVQGNWIGTDTTGAASVGNVNGVEVDASGEVIGGLATLGGTAASARNIISGNSNDGVIIDSGITGVQVQGNYIGTDVSGTKGVANSIGVEAAGSTNTIGGKVSGAGNLISGNSNDGVLIDSSVSAVHVQGNYIGIDVTGTEALGNGLDGVLDQGTSDTIGGSAAGAGNTISANSGVGVDLLNSSAALVAGNYIGTNASGSSALGNGIGSNDGGIAADGSASTVGGTSAGARNIISGNVNYGISISSAGTLVEGNYIGTDVSGTKGVANGTIGVLVLLTSGDTIGGTASGQGNLISGNSGADGVFLDGASGVLLQGNTIGADVTGAKTLVNQNGIEIGGGSGTTIGGTTSTAANVISGNTGDGVLIDKGSSGILVQGNFIGTDSTGSKPVANSVGIEDDGTNDTLGGSGAGNYISGNSTDGVLLDNKASGETVQGNFIGTNSTGAGAVGNSIGIADNGSNNTIGGTGTGALNVISGNSDDGVLLTSSVASVLLQSNYIGTNSAGVGAVGNSIGVEVQASNITLGSTVSGTANVISGNSTDGVLIDSTVSGVQVQGNLIGTDHTGTQAVGNFNGLYVLGSSNTIGGTTAEVRNIISGNTDGIYIGASSVTVQGNYIGTDISGTKAVANNQGIGVYYSDNTIGGTESGARNIISGNKFNGVTVGSTGVVVQGNYIGTDYTGTKAIGNSTGVEVGYDHCTIGGTATGAGNTISGNSGDGVFLDSSVSLVQGNYIGTDVTGTVAVANSNGVEVGASQGNTIGGTSTSAANLISGNSNDGVLFDSGSGQSAWLQGNYIGTDYTGTKGVGNSVGVEIQLSNLSLGGTASGTGNIISGNSKYGVLIDSGVSGVQVQGNYIGTDSTGSKAVANGANGVIVIGSNNNIGGSVANAANIIANNAGGGVYVSKGTGNTIRLDTITANGPSNTGPGITLSNGGNNNLAAPSLSSASMSQNTLSVMGSFTPAAANATYTLDFFANSSSDPEGKVYLGSLTVTPTSTSSQSFTFMTLTRVPTTYPLVTATLTDALGDTSAFSSGTTVSNPLPSYEYLVSSTADDGSLGTLRDAITVANASGGKITLIDFSIGASGSAQTINLTSALPALTDSGVFINGLSQGGATAQITVNGTNAGAGSDGFLLQSSNNTISGLIVEDFKKNGIEVAASNNTIGGTTTGAGNVLSGNSNDGLLIDSGVSGVQVQGNYIGTNAAGNAALGNSIGVYVSSTGNTIGGATAGAGNVISGNSADGVYIGASGVSVLGNYIGTDVTGTKAVGNSIGVEVGAAVNTLGGTTSGTANIISGNTKDGVLIDAGASGVSVLGNFIGSDLTGKKAVANSIGIEVAGNSNNIVGGNYVPGGTVQGGRNIISGNSKDGVLIDSGATGNLVIGNYIGTDISGTKSLGNKNGVEVAGNNNTVGASYAVGPNVISANSNDGVLLDQGATGNQVLGNYIGTNYAGSAALANKVGIEDAGSNNTIGGSVAFVRNVISGNSGDGVLLDSTATAETVEGNYIGLNYLGKSALANAGNGVEIKGNGNTIGGAGGTNYYVSNFLSGNTKDGVLIDNGATGNQVLGNYIGLDITRAHALANVLNGIEIAGSSNTIGTSIVNNRNIISGNGNDGLLLDSTASANLVQSNAVGTDASQLTAVANKNNGIEIMGTNNTLGGTVATVRNVISGNSKDGVLIDIGASGNLLEGDFMGITMNNTAVANSGNGVEIAGNNNTIGGAAFYARNFLSGNGKDGVLIDSGASGNQVLANYIGTDVFGTTAVSNSIGVEVAGSNNTVGGSTQGTVNIISGNSGDGVLLDLSASGNQVMGNWIGMNTYDTAALGNSGNGIEVKGKGNTLGSTNPAVNNEISANSNDGVFLDSTASGNQVLGNFIGTNHAGMAAEGNKVGIEDAGSNNTLGGSVNYARNVISGNIQDGVLLDSGESGDTVQGNNIGLNIDGNAPIANGTNGLEIKGKSNLIGGNYYSNHFVRNLISGNGNDGVLIDSGASGNAVQGNLIGLDGTGTQNLGNGANGVQIIGNNNTVGGSVVGLGNGIAYNSANGVLVSVGTGNTIQSNSIFANTGLSIDLVNGGNNNVAAPSISSASYSSGTNLLTVSGTFNAPVANVSYVIQLFASPSSGEGAVYLGSVTVTPTSTGTIVFNFSCITTAVTSNPIITATITDSSGNTSEFSLGKGV